MSQIVKRRSRCKVIPFSKSAHNDDPQIEALKKFYSRQLSDPFTDLYASTANHTTIAPAYNPDSLLRLPNENSILRQCIDAYCVNIESFGYRLEYIGKDKDQHSADALAERDRILSLMNQPNDEYSMIELRQRVRRDMETLGYGFIEVGRDAVGEIAMLYHVIAHKTRITQKDSKATPVKRSVIRAGKVIEQTVMKRFCRYIQKSGSKTIYFKEFGDPRSIDPKTGKVNEGLAIEDQATELYHVPLYAPGNPYGLPRWINQLPNVLGTRESEMTNLQFFKDNAIPALAVLVSGGMLTDNAVENIENHFTHVRGRDSLNRVLVIEATGDEGAASEKGQVPAPRVDLKPLSEARQKDGMFQEYETKTQAKIRSSFRLPPLFLGLTEDMTYATAAASLSVAEAQVFGPERNKIDEIINTHLLAFNKLPPQHWRFRSNPPRISNSEDVVTAIEKLEAVGAMTPNTAIGLANELFDLNIATIEEDWGNYPISFSTQVLAEGQLAGVGALYTAAKNDQAKNDQVSDSKLADLEKEIVRLKKVAVMRKRKRQQPQQEQPQQEVTSDAVS